MIGDATLASGDTWDWLPAGAGFRPVAFAGTWEAVAAAIASGGRQDRGK